MTEVLMWVGLAWLAMTAVATGFWVVIGWLAYRGLARDVDDESNEG